MAKAYTDFEQSQKLAEFLPKDSYDMYLSRIDDGRTYMPHFGKTIIIDGNMFSYRNGYVVPCWSLTALFDVLPEGVIDKCYVPNLQKENGKYSIAYGDDELLCIADNPIDTCYEMIMKLHEQKLI